VNFDENSTKERRGHECGSGEKLSREEKKRKGEYKEADLAQENFGEEEIPLRTLKERFGNCSGGSGQEGGKGGRRAISVF